jgi:hypothetical protein
VMRLRQREQISEVRRRVLYARVPPSRRGANSSSARRPWLSLTGDAADISLGRPSTPHCGVSLSAAARRNPGAWEGFPVGPRVFLTGQCGPPPTALLVRILMR